MGLSTNDLQIAHNRMEKVHTWIKFLKINASRPWLQKTLCRVFPTTQHGLQTSETITDWYGPADHN